MLRKTFGGWGFAPDPEWELTSPIHLLLFEGEGKGKGKVRVQEREGREKERNNGMEGGEVWRNYGTPAVKI